MEEIIIYIKKNAKKEKYEDYKKECIQRYCERIHYKEKIEIQKEIQGKPYIKNNPFYFNVSHSYDYYLIAFSQSKIGIDIEKHRDRNYHYIAKRYYNKEEFDYIHEHGKKAFFDLWCMKESYTKYLGESIFQHLEVKMVDHHQLITKKDNLSFYPLDIDKNYSSYLVSLQHIQIKEIYI